MIRIVFVASGSKGNSTLITDSETLIQIDMGCSKSALRDGLSALNKNIEDIEALFITHDHGDHIKGIPFLSPSTAIYSTPCSIEENLIFETIEPYVGINVGSFTVFPFSTSHDAPNPVGYLISNGGEKLGYVTDTGILDDTALGLLKNCDYYLFESNYDLEMLLKSKRPKELKDRIRGDHGHLSNVDSALYMSTLIGDKTKAIYLGHISEECNTPEKALSCYRRILFDKGIDTSRIAIIPTKQWEIVMGGD